LWERATALGLDVERFDADRRSDAVKARVKRDFESGIRGGVVTTPTLFAGDVKFTGEIDADTLASLARSTSRLGGP
jgi:protein-disulfide isomerase